MLACVCAVGGGGGGSAVIVFWQMSIGLGFDLIGVRKPPRESVAPSPAESLNVDTQGVEKRECGCLNRLHRHQRCFITTFVSTTTVFHSSILRYLFD